MPSAHPASMGLLGSAIWEEIAFTGQDSLCIYLYLFVTRLRASVNLAKGKKIHHFDQLET